MDATGLGEIANGRQAGCSEESVEPAAEPLVFGGSGVRSRKVSATMQLRLG
jgi:hypothetical protein